MKKFRFPKSVSFALTIGLLAALLVACQPIRPITAPLSAAEEEQFLAAVMGFEEAYQQKDLEGMVDFYADDAISYPPGYRTDVGKDAIRASLAAFFDTYEMEREFTLAGTEIKGDTAMRVGEWTQVLTPKAGGETITEVGRCIVGFKKVNGEWKVAWEIWNTYDPAPQ